MTIQEMGALGEMIGGIAVVISLIYVGLQIRQNSNSVRAASQIALRQLGTEITSQIAAPDMARIYVQGLKDISPLPLLLWASKTRLLRSTVDFAPLFCRSRAVDWRKRKKAGVRG